LYKPVASLLVIVSQLRRSGVNLLAEGNIILFGRAATYLGVTTMIAKVKQFKKKDRVRSIISSIFFLVLILAGVAFLAVSNLRISKRRQDLLSQIAKLEEEIKIQEKKNEELKAGISQVSNQDYLEEEARERLGLKKPGEEVVAISNIEIQEQETETGKEKSLWQKILEFFK
jgi:cell division protein FtsL